MELPKAWDPRRVTLWGAVLLVLLASVVAAFPPDEGRNDWQRLERVASVAQVVGLLGVGFVFAQLRVMVDEQRRIRKELASRPVLRIERWRQAQGDRIVNIVYPDPRRASYSLPFTVELAIHNEGKKTAFNVKVTATIAGLFVSGPRSLEKPGAGGHWQLLHPEVIHPEGTLGFPIEITVPMGTDKYDLVVRASCNDTPQVKTAFPIEVRPDTPTPQPSS